MFDTKWAELLNYVRMWSALALALPVLLNWKLITPNEPAPMSVLRWPLINSHLMEAEVCFYGVSCKEKFTITI